MTTDRDDLTAQAAAYALNTSTDAERAELDERRASDPALDLVGLSVAVFPAVRHGA